MTNIIIKIKRKENVFFRYLYEIAKACIKFSFPINKVTRPFFSFLYFLHVTVKAVIYYLLKTFYYEPLFKSQCKSVGVNLVVEKLPFIIGFGHIYLGDNVTLSGKINIAFSNQFLEAPTLRVGNHSYIAHNAIFSIAQSIEIGSHCLVGGVSIADNDGHTLDYLKRRDNRPPATHQVKGIKIGDDVWICNNTIILKGVEIGDRSIIAPGAVVTKSIPSDCVAAGNPAVVVKKLS